MRVCGGWQTAQISVRARSNGICTSLDTLFLVADIARAAASSATAGGGGSKHCNSDLGALPLLVPAAALPPATLAVSPWRKENVSGRLLKR